MELMKGEGLIFKPTKEKLFKAKQQRLEKWKQLGEKEFTEESRNERYLLELEISQAMGVLRERANKCLKETAI